MSEQSAAPKVVWVKFSLRNHCHIHEDKKYWYKNPSDTYSLPKGILFLGWLQRTEIKPKDWASQLLPEIQTSWKRPDQRKKEAYLKTWCNNCCKELTVTVKCSSTPTQTVWDETRQLALGLEWPLNTAQTFWSQDWLQHCDEKVKHWDQRSLNTENRFFPGLLENRSSSFSIGPKVALLGSLFASLLMSNEHLLGK